MKLSLLICSLESRITLLERLLKCIDKQGTLVSQHERIDGVMRLYVFNYSDFQVCILSDNGEKSIGFKRNYLLNIAECDYICWTDDDDMLADNYIDLVMEGINKGVDACSLTGIITTDGNNPKKFIHSIRYDSWFEAEGVYYRNTNHLNVVKTSIARRMKFPEINHGEDKNYSQQLFDSGLIKDEHWIEPVIYFYEYVSK